MNIVSKGKNTKILFGTDPESFAVYERENKVYVLPPYFFRAYRGVEVKGELPHPIFLEGDGFKAHEDGAAFEFSIFPSHDPGELFGRIQEAASQVSKNILSNFLDDCTGKLQFVPTVGFDVERWAEEGDEFRFATRFGCDPDEDVWDLESESYVMDASKHPWRYAGGHIHVSGSTKIEQDPHLAIMCMAFTAGLAAIAYTPWPNLEKDRTYLYGKPGKFRIQNYGPENPFGPEYSVGIEYRTPSATWAGNWEVAQPVLKWAEIGIKNLFETKLGEELARELPEEVIPTILSANREKAQELLSYIESRL